MTNRPALKSSCAPHLSKHVPVFCFVFTNTYSSFSRQALIVLLLAFIQWGHQSPYALWHIRQTNGHKTRRCCSQGFWLVFVPSVALCNDRASSVVPMYVAHVQYNGLTLICIVFSFQLELTCVCLHRQQSTLEILLLAILGVFKCDVPLQIKTENRGAGQSVNYQSFEINSSTVNLCDWLDNVFTAATGDRNATHACGSRSDISSALNDLKIITIDDTKSFERAWKRSNGDDAD